MEGAELRESVSIASLCRTVRDVAEDDLADVLPEELRTVGDEFRDGAAVVPRSRMVLDDEEFDLKTVRSELFRMVGDVIRVGTLCRDKEALSRDGAVAVPRSRMARVEGRFAVSLERTEEDRGSVVGRAKELCDRDPAARSMIRRGAFTISFWSVRPDRMESRPGLRSRAPPSRVRRESSNLCLDISPDRDEKSRPTCRSEPRSRTRLARFTTSASRFREGRRSGWACRRLIRPKSTPDRSLRTTSESRRCWSWSRRTTVRDRA